jgi:3-dehydroquinate synthetase
MNLNKGELYKKTISLKPSVDVYFGIEIPHHLPNVLQHYLFDKVFFITDAPIYDLHGKALCLQLINHGLDVETVLITGDEEHKTFPCLGLLCNELLDRKVTKDSIVIGFGGGLICNIAGLAASLIFRGIKYIEIPTTVMGQTDSSLSNKQAVNGDSGKNQLGTYYAPLFVWSDINYTLTEDTRHVNAAIVESFKNALIQNADLLDSSSINYPKETYSIEDLAHIFEVTTDSKNRILLKDPTEKGYAVILEYGHTFGHAIEFITNGAIIHGEAVAAGMCIAAEISNKLGLLLDDEIELHYDLLSGFINQSLIEMCDSLLSAEQIYLAIQNDNKRNKQGVQYVLLSGIGKCVSNNGTYREYLDKDIVIDGINSFYDKFKMKTGFNQGERI